MASDSEDENFLFHSMEDDLFEESQETLQARDLAGKHSEMVAKRRWGLSQRDKWGHSMHRNGSICLRHNEPWTSPTNECAKGAVDVKGQVSVLFKEEPGQQRRVWDCSLVLARFLVNPTYFSSTYFKGKKCIELGCGIGVPGLAAAALGAKEVMLTDFEQAIPWIEMNIELNRKSFGEGVLVETHALEWDLPIDRLVFDPPYDVILCSDLIYGDVQTSELLVQAIQRLSTAATRVIFAHEKRFAGDHGRSFFDIMAGTGQYTIREVPLNDLDAEYRGDNISVHLLDRHS